MNIQPPEEPSGVSSRTPPYVAYRTFLTLIDDLSTNGLPPQIDNSVLRRFSGGVGAQLKMALRSLGLINDQNQPTKLLERLVAAHNTPEFPAAMRDALQLGYPFLSALDLKTATPSMFADAFKGTGAREDVLKKCRRFYLQAAAEIGIPLGPRITNATEGRSGTRTASNSPGAPQAKRAVAPRRQKPQKRPPPPGGNTLPPTSQTVQQQLIGKFPEFDPAWDDSIKKAWFDGFKDLMGSTTGKENGGS